MKRKLGVIVLIIGLVCGIFAAYGTFAAKKEYDDLSGEFKVQYSFGQYSNAVSTASAAVELEDTIKKMYVLDGLCGTAIIVGIILLAISKKENTNMLEEKT